MLTDKDLLLVKGGALSGAIIDAAVNFLNTIYNFGKSLGSSIYRVVTGNYCK